MKDLVIKEQDLPVTSAVTPMVLLQQAVESKADIDQLTKLMDLQDRYEAREAEKAFTVAMAQFKANAPTINKDKDVKYGNTSYSHASLGNVCEKITSGLSEYGLSHSWENNQNGELITVTCKITHILGHSKDVSITTPPDKSGAKNTIQAIASAITYMQRYTLLAATGLAAGEDDDGVATSKEIKFISENDVISIAKAAQDKGVDLSLILQAYSIDNISKLPLVKYAECLNRINLSKGKK